MTQRCSPLRSFSDFHDTAARVAYPSLTSMPMPVASSSRLYSSASSLVSKTSCRAWVVPSGSGSFHRRRCRAAIRPDDHGPAVTGSFPFFSPVILADGTSDARGAQQSDSAGPADGGKRRLPLLPHQEDHVHEAHSLGGVPLIGLLIGLRGREALKTPDSARSPRAPTRDKVSNDSSGVHEDQSHRRDRNVRGRDGGSPGARGTAPTQFPSTYLHRAAHVPRRPCGGTGARAREARRLAVRRRPQW